MQGCASDATEEAMTISFCSMQPCTNVDQACAIPYRRGKNRVEFCVITSSHGRWIFPKGFIDPGRDVEQTALAEAFEEAGLHGRIVGQPLGCYDAQKVSGTYKVIAKLMEVRRCEGSFGPEEERRQRRWVTPG